MASIINKIVDGTYDLASSLKNTGYKSAKQLEQEQAEQASKDRLTNISKSMGLSGSFKESTITSDEAKQLVIQNKIKQQQKKLEKEQQLQAQAEKISQNIGLSSKVSISKPNIEKEYISPNFDNFNNEQKPKVDTISSFDDEINEFLRKEKIPNYADVVDKPPRSNDYSYVFEQDNAHIENFSGGFKAVEPPPVKSKSGGNTTVNLQSGSISANDFAAMSGSDNRASSYMGKRLANRLNGTKAKIKTIQDNADLSEADKTKQINDIYSTFGDNVKNIDDVSRILQQEAQNGPDIRDYVHAYSGHVVGAGMVLGMGNAVLDAADTKGQKTNAQLYSNPF